MTIKIPRLMVFSESECRSICLYQILESYGVTTSLEEIIRFCKESFRFRDWDYYLGRYALKKGLRVKIHTRSLSIFDPTWFDLDKHSLKRKIRKKLESLEKLSKKYPGFRKFALESRGAIDFLDEEGDLSFEAFSQNLIGRYLSKDIPIIVTFTGQLVYAMPKEKHGTADDVEGDPWKHSVVVNGFDKSSYYVVDPSQVIGKAKYRIKKDILLDGIIRYDSNILAVFRKDRVS